MFAQLIGNLVEVLQSQFLAKQMNCTFGNLTCNSEARCANGAPGICGTGLPKPREAGTGPILISRDTQFTTLAFWIGKLLPVIVQNMPQPGRSIRPCASEFPLMCGDQMLW